MVRGKEGWDFLMGDVGGESWGERLLGTFWQGIAKEKEEAC